MKVDFKIVALSVLFCIATLFPCYTEATPVNGDQWKKLTKLGRMMFTEEKPEVADKPSYAELERQVSAAFLRREWKNRVDNNTMPKTMEEMNQVMTDMLKRLGELRQTMRLKKCIGLFESKAICSNSSPFYMWAKLVAANIMKGDVPT